MKTSKWFSNAFSRCLRRRNIRNYAGVLLMATVVYYTILASVQKQPVNVNQDLLGSLPRATRLVHKSLTQYGNVSRDRPRELEVGRTAKAEKSEIKPATGNASMERRSLPGMRKAFGGVRESWWDGVTHDSGCHNVKPPQESDLLRDAEFLPTHSGSSYVFSAYLDDRDDKNVRVRTIGMINTHIDAIPHYCQLWFNGKNGPILHVVYSRNDIIAETHNLAFAGFIYTCLLPDLDPPGTYPFAVSMTEGKCDAPEHYLPVTYSKKNRSRESDDVISVCVPPIFNAFDDVNLMLEFIETNRMFGADRFIFYNYSIGHNVRKHLNMYEKEGIVEVVPWTKPRNVIFEPNLSPNIHYYGQLVSENDCLYRAIDRGSSYVLFTDLDEFIVPKKGRSWRGIIKHYFNNTEACSIGFRNVFFRTDFTQDELYEQDDQVQRLQLRTMLFTEREDYIWEHHERSKYIASAHRIEIAGVHFPWRCFTKTLYTEIEPYVALLHHYRVWGDNKVPRTTVDRSLHRYRDQIVKRVLERHALIS